MRRINDKIIKVKKEEKELIFEKGEHLTYDGESNLVVARKWQKNCAILDIILFDNYKCFLWYARCHIDERYYFGICEVKLKL